MNKFYAISSGLGYGVYLFLIMLSSRTGMPAIVGALTLQFVAMISGVISYQLSPNKPSFQQLPFNGFLLAAAAGVAVQLGELLSFKAYEQGLGATAGSLIIVGLQVLVPAILGVVFLKESLNTVQLVAVGLILVGVGMFSIAK